MPGAVSRLALIVIVSVLLASAVALTLRMIDARRAPPIVIVDVAAERPVIVVIDGAVGTPGIQTLPAGARLNDAVVAAGGFTDSADTDELNPARLLVDGERVTVGQITPEAVASDAGSSGGGVVESGGEGVSARGSYPTVTSTVEPTTTVTTVTTTGNAIDINTAGAAQLDGLPGIGPVLAERIIAYRDENGPYQTVDELEAVEGISLTMVEELRPLVTVGAGTT